MQRLGVLQVQQTTSRCTLFCKECSSVELEFANVGCFHVDEKLTANMSPWYSRCNKRKKGKNGLELKKVYTDEKKIGYLK